MAEKSQRQEIFGTDDESSTSSCDEAINSSISESDKLGRGAPKKKSNERVRITIQQKMQAVQHFQANKGMTQAALIEWCFHKFGMKKRLGKGTVSAWFKEGGKGQKAKLEKAIATETNPFKLKAKSFKGAHYPELEHELFVWIRRIETKKACLTDDVIMEKARAIAERTKVSDGPKHRKRMLKRMLNLRQPCYSVARGKMMRKKQTIVLSECP